MLKAEAMCSSISTTSAATRPQEKKSTGLNKNTLNGSPVHEVLFLPVNSNMASVTSCFNTQDSEAIEKFSWRGSPGHMVLGPFICLSRYPVCEQAQPMEASGQADLDRIEKHSSWLCSSQVSLCVSSFEAWPGLCWLSVTLLYYSHFQAWGCVTLGQLQLSQGIVSKCFLETKNCWFILI